MIDATYLKAHRQVSDYTGAAALLDDLPKAQWLLGDRGYDAELLLFQTNSATCFRSEASNLLSARMWSTNHASVACSAVAGVLRFVAT